MVKDFGWKEPVGMTVTLYDTTRLTVIGVVKDFYINGLWQKINPTMLRLSSNDQYGVLAVRAEPKDLPAVLDYLSLKWKSQATNFIFGGMYQILAASIMFVATLLTIIFKIGKAALRNPVDSLRYE